MHHHAVNYLISRIEASDLQKFPFNHLEISDIFPSDYFDHMLRSIPSEDGFKPLLHREAITSMGGSTRGELYLEEEALAHLPAVTRNFWLDMGEALRDPSLANALKDKLQVEGDIKAKPLLYQDRSGYRISPHTDISAKAITMQVYMPPDERWKEIGTTFYVRKDDRFDEVKRVPFVPNQSYAFRVSDDSWHGVEPVRIEGVVRSSLMLIFYHEHALTSDGKLNFNDPNVSRSIM